MDQVAALVLAGGRGVDFGVLSEHRTKAAFPIAGYYRIIDFVLSNLCHSGVRQAGVIIQYMPASLMEHIGSGRPWQFDMADRSLRIMTPFVGVNEIRWFQGTGDAIAKNINLLNLSGVQDVLIVSGEHVYTMDYRLLLAQHRETHADVTFACVEIPPEQQCPRFGNVTVAEDGRVTSFLEKPERPVSRFVSMGIYLLRLSVLQELLHELEAAGARDFNLAGDVLSPNIGRLNAQAWVFGRPWHYFANLQEYYDFHMRLAAGELDLLNSSWNIITNFNDRGLTSRVPAIFAQESEVERSIISPGCRIQGRVSGSVLSPGVEVGPGAVVERCLIFHDVKIGAGCRLAGAIIDKDVVIEAGVKVGGINEEIVVLPKGARISG